MIIRCKKKVAEEKIFVKNYETLFYSIIDTIDEDLYFVLVDFFFLSLGHKIIFPTNFEIKICSIYFNMLICTSYIQYSYNNFIWTNGMCSRWIDMCVTFGWSWNKFNAAHTNEAMNKRKNVTICTYIYLYYMFTYI